MARCPACDYDLASLPGAPTAPDEPFRAGVRCPECGRDFAQGTLLLAGSAFVAALQPATRRARVGAAVLSFAPALFLVVQGVEGIVELWTGTGAWWANLLRIALLGIVAVLLVRAFRLWRPADGGTGAPIAGRDMAWEVRPGCLETFTRSDGSRIPVGKAFDGASLRNVVAHAAPEVSIRPGERPNNVVLLEAYFWVVDRDGRRSDIQSTVIYVDAGGTRAELPGGRRAASIAAGHRLAAATAAALRGLPAPAPRDGPAPGAAAEPRAMVATGSPHVVRQLQRGRAAAVLTGFVAWCALTAGATLAAVLSGLLVAGNAGAGFLAIAAAAAPAGAGLWWMHRRIHRRRAAEVATWTAAPGELRVDVADGRRPGRAAVHGRAHPVPRLHEVAAVPHDGRPVLVARTRGGRAIARLDANLSAGEADLLARRMTVLIWEGRSAPT